MMGGDIGFDSKLGEGSTFWLTAPARIVTEIDAGEHLAGSVEQVDLAPLNILVVDDVEVNRELVATLLSPFDVTLFEAANGADAIKAAVERRYDVILMDLQMPGMDGMAATKAIRGNSELNRATPILALSANVLPEQIAACAAAGMDDHVAKPISPGDLLSKIARWTAGAPVAPANAARRTAAT